MNRKFSSIVFMLIFVQFVNAQGVRLNHYNTENGLVQNQVLALFTDKQNFLWAGTKGGVSRFDGLNFKNFTNADGLYSGEVSFITQDSSGAIWVGRKYGLSKIYKNKISNYNFPATSKLTLYFNTKPGIVCQTYVADQIVYYLFENNAYKVIHELADYPEYSYVERDRIQIQTFEGYSYSVDLCTGELRDRVPTKKRLWAQNSFASYYTDSAGVEFDYFNGKKYFLPLPANQPFNLIEFNPGNFVWTTNGNTYIYQNYRLIETLENFAFSCASFTTEGFYFFGTETGLYVLSNFAFKHFETGKNGLNHEIWSIANFNDTIWAVANAAKAYYFKNNKFVPTKLTLENNDFFNFNHLAFRGNYAWTSHHGMLVKERKTGYFMRVPIDASALSLAADSVKKMHLIGTTAGLITLDFDKDWKVKENYNTDLTGKHWMLSSILSIVTDTSQVIWLTTNSGIASLKNGNVTYYTDSIFRSGAISSVIDYRKNLWFGGKGGLIHYNYRKFSRINFDVLSTAMGDITSLHFINNKDLLIGTTRGLAMFDVVLYYTTGQVRASWFDKKMGFAGTECQQNNILSLSDSVLWIPMTDRIVKVNPKLLAYYTTIDTPVLVQVTADLNGKSEPADFLFPNFPSENKSLRFEFASPSYINPKMIRYRYVLKGATEFISELTTEKSIRFNDLPAGSYSLEVYYSNGMGEWAKSPKNFNFSIAYTWYEDPVNKLIAAVFLILLTFFFSWFFIRFQQKKRINKEKIKQNEAHNFLNMVTMQLDPHFIFNIMAFTANQALGQKSMNDYIVIVELTELLRQHWAAKELIRPLESEIDFVRAYLSLFKRLRGEKFKWKLIDTDVTDISTPVIKQSIILFVENAIKHGIEQKNEGGEITVIIANEPENLVITVTDNGIGYKASLLQKKDCNQSRGLGLKKFTEIIEFFNKENKQKITFNVTDVSDENPMKQGTKVEIKYPNNYRFITY